MLSGVDGVDFVDIVLGMDYDLDISAEVMANFLMDPHWSTYNMFESLCGDYINASPDAKHGMDIAAEALTGYSVQSIAETVYHAIVEHYDDLEDED